MSRAIRQGSCGVRNDGIRLGHRGDRAGHGRRADDLGAVMEDQAPRVIATVTDYNGLLAALRLRANELQVAGETLDDVCGLPTRYVAKLLGPKPVRRIGMLSLGSLLGALGLALAVVEDAETMQRYGDRLTKRNGSAVRAGTVQFAISRRFMRKIQAQGGKNSRKYMTPGRARQLARKAARARWDT